MLVAVLSPDPARLERLLLMLPGDMVSDALLRRTGRRLLLEDLVECIVEVAPPARGVDGGRLAAAGSDV